MRIEIVNSGQLFGTSSGWVDRHEIPIIYGDCSNRTDMKWLGLRTGEQMYYARNSKGKPYVGTPGLTFYVDNVGFRY